MTEPVCICDTFMAESNAGFMFRKQCGFENNKVFYTEIHISFFRAFFFISNLCLSFEVACSLAYEHKPQLNGK